MASTSLPIITFEDHPEGISLLRDGDPILTPKRSNLVLPNMELAAAVAREFEGVVPHPAGGSSTLTHPVYGGGKGGALSADDEAAVKSDSLPPSPPVNGGDINSVAPDKGNISKTKYLTKIAYTAIDLVELEYDMLVEAMLAYLHTDSICYFAETPELAKRERKHWQPILDWASTELACDIMTFEGVMPVDQAEETVEAVKNYINTLGSWHVAVLLDFTRGFSSFLLAMAVMEGRIDADTAFTCSQVDEDYQREEWGAEDEAMERREKLRTEMLAAEQFLQKL